MADTGPERDRRIPQEDFYTRQPPPKDRPFTRWVRDPLKQAGVLVLIGGFGVFVEQANVFFQIVVGAPVFEELLKFGVALALVALLRLPGRLAPFLVALAVGAGFGALEHYVSYPEEPVRALRFRLAFHGGSTALSAAVYGAIVETVDVHARWAVTVPASLVHWVNNFFALVLGLAGVATGAIDEASALAFAEIVAGITLLLALLALVGAGPTRRLAEGVWEHLAPASLKGPRPGTVRFAPVSDPGTPEDPRRPGGP